jgi:hypothetical protein
LAGSVAVEPDAVEALLTIGAVADRHRGASQVGGTGRICLKNTRLPSINPVVGAGAGDTCGEVVGLCDRTAFLT